MTTADSVSFCRYVCFGLLLVTSEKWKLGDFGLLFMRDWHHDFRKIWQPFWCLQFYHS